MAQPGKYYVTFLPLVVVWDLFNSSIVTVRVNRYITWIPTVGHNPTEPHQYIPVDEAVV